MDVCIDSWWWSFVCKFFACFLAKYNSLFDHITMMVLECIGGLFCCRYRTLFPFDWKWNSIYRRYFLDHIPKNFGRNFGGAMFSDVDASVHVVEALFLNNASHDTGGAMAIFGTNVALFNTSMIAILEKSRRRILDGRFKTQFFSGLCPQQLFTVWRWRWQCLPTFPFR